MRTRVFLAFLALVTSAFPALAQSRHGGPGPSLDRVLPEIRRTMPGTFYDAEGPFVGPDGSASYRIKWMTPDGRIVWFYADARTGRILGVGPVTPPGGRRNEFRDRNRDRDWPPAGGDDGRGHWRDGGDWGNGNGNRGGGRGGRGGGDWDGGNNNGSQGGDWGGGRGNRGSRGGRHPGG
jgi:hypothetical protein